MPAEIEMDFEHVARGAGKRRHDRGFAPRQPIEQRRFAGIGRTGDGDPQPFAQPFPLPEACLADLLGQWPNERQRPRHSLFRDVVLVGKIDAGLDQSERLDQPLARGLGPIAEHALEVPERLPALGLGFGCDQVGEALDRGQVHAAVLERAAGEFARLGGAETFELAERRQHGSDHRAPAMHLQLGDVLAGLTVRRREPERQPFVDELVGPRIAHARERRQPRLRHAADHPGERIARARARDAHDRA